MEFTAKKTIKMAIVGGAVAATALLSACSGNSVAGNGSPVRNAAETAAVEQVPEGGGQGAATGGSGATANGDVDCSKYGGPVGAPGRTKMDLIAVAATDGTKPGCTEAFTVIAEYYQKLPQAEGPGERVLDVQGKWTCARQAGSAGEEGAVVCGVPNSSLQLETRPSGGAPEGQVRKFPNSTQRVQFAGYDAGTRMVRFELVTHQDSPVDGRTYRLPLQKGGEVFSAATLCPSDSVTIDDQGFGSRPCGQEQLIQQLKDGNPVLAQISVNGDDRISTVKEIYRP
ncbi:hypothetical protein [Amycolatopsis sp. BJA-103]|uniref:hypothetical protein n=1 Tax=Amycolatopsis sp. BJA-103 TaxID=1911175 RepID=UPI000C79435F|nr:hypothetical protein [Amycolatopsis sp. BJA-103]AUI64021.1 hypothetical protein BKN51_41655 [Amycolatopsis sp. BJA-103]PNE16052.1 hypothetical protein B1H26_27540 [Amycolatopsis sp. BJA-103]